MGAGDMNKETHVCPSPSCEKHSAPDRALPAVLKLHCRSALAPTLLCLSAVSLWLAYGCYASSRHWGVHAQLDHMWGFATEAGHEYTAPVFLNEFGERKNTFFHSALTSYIQERDLDFSYWALNGQKYTDGWWPESYGLLSQSWTHFWGLKRIHDLGLGHNVAPTSILGSDGQK